MRQSKAVYWHLYFSAFFAMMLLAASKNCNLGMPISLELTEAYLTYDGSRYVKRPFQLYFVISYMLMTAHSLLTLYMMLNNSSINSGLL